MDVKELSATERTEKHGEGMKHCGAQSSVRETNSSVTIHEIFSVRSVFSVAIKGVRHDSRP